METFRFIADSAAAALAQIHAQLGPDAVVLEVQRQPARGMAKLWQRSRGVEIVAGVPAESQVGTSRCDVLMGESANRTAQRSFSKEPTLAWLESMDLLPEFADRLQSRIDAVSNGLPPGSIEEQWARTCTALASFWRQPTQLNDNQPARPHVFIGPAGSGKTTVLCKWLTLAVLTEEKRASVWRLDANTANTAEFLEVHCEMLGVPLERFWAGPLAGLPPELLFVDFPGVEPHDPGAIDALRVQINSLPSPRIHLVLNAAYETTVLLEQWRTFAQFNPEDVIFTHLDEELRRVKLWNLVLGTNCSLRFLSAGQKIPGEFLRAIPELLFPSQIPR